MIGKRDFYFGAVRNERTGGLKPEQRFLGKCFARFAGVIGVIESDGDDLGRRNRRQSFQTLEGNRLLVESRRPKNVAMQAE